jgi:hypothetical protein
MVTTTNSTTLLQPYAAERVAAYTQCDRYRYIQMTPAAAGVRSVPDLFLEVHLY